MSRGLDLLWQPLKRYADFHGRATRTELAFFWALLMLISLPLFLAAMLGALSWEGQRIGQWVISLFLFCPFMALLVRRLHDQGRSGWWLLSGLPAFAAVLVDYWRQVTLGREAVGIDGPLAVEVLAGISALAVLVLILLPEQSDANLYGPNPRDGPIGESA